MRSITMPDLTAEELFSKAVCMSLTIRKIGLTRKAKVKVKSRADQNMFHITKSLVTCDEYSKIEHLDSRIRRQLHRYDLPAKIGRGMAIVPASALNQLSHMIEDFRNERASLIDADRAPIALSWPKTTVFRSRSRFFSASWSLRETLFGGIRAIFATT